MEPSIRIPPRASLLGLPTEVQEHIIQYLNFPEIICLMITCTWFNNLIRPLTHRELLEAENTLRGEPGANNRFCVECGINPSKGTTRYTVGSQIIVQGVLYVICGSCRSFKKGAKDDDGNNTAECESCWRFRRAIKQRNDEHRARQERARKRAEQTARRAVRREMYGSEHEDSDEDIPPSPTWSDDYFEMIQAEADQYMNSPKSGSE
ncbi:hypothetical protein M432DRAFT_658985 [Thermoascus aurantiacus ATCC 26904]